jgi:hypothetical protein
VAFTNGPNIVRDGLVFYIDAANGQSYPGSGTTANTLLGTSNATLHNGVTITTEKGGTFNCDGSTDYIQTQISDPGNQATTEFWIKMDLSSGANKMMCAWRYYSIYNQNGNLGFNTGNGDIYGISSSDISTLGISNNWMHLVLFWNSNISYTNNKMYINGQLQTISQQQSSEATGYRSFDSGNFGIGCWNVAHTPGLNSPPNLANAKIYNRELSASEVAQNYNALKSRFE